MVDLTLAELMTVTRLVAAINVVVLLGLVGVWVQGYWRFRAQHTLGLLAFGVLLLVQNLLAVYLYSFDPDFTQWMSMAEPTAMLGMAGLTLLQLAALLFMGWITWT